MMGQGVRWALSLLLAAGVATGVGLTFLSAAAQAQGPTISSISPVSNTTGPILVITGSGFGSAFAGLDQSTDSNFLELADTHFLGWNAGYTGDWCPVTVLQWTDSKIVVHANGIGTLTCGLSNGMAIDVTVWSTSDPSASNSMATTVVSAPSSVSSLSPSYGPTSGGTLSVNTGTGAVTPQAGGSVAIGGSGFTSSTVEMVLFGTIPASTFTVVNSGELTAVPPVEQNASTLPVTVVMNGGSSSTGCLSINLLCSYAYDYLSAYPVNSSVDGQVFDGTFSIAPSSQDDFAGTNLEPCTGGGSGTVELNVTADASLSGSGYVSSLSELPFAAALASNVDLSTTSLNATLNFNGSGQFTCTFPIPGVNLGGLAGLNLYVSGSVGGQISIPYTISNVAATLSGGFIGTTLVGPSDSVTCGGAPITSSNATSCAHFGTPSGTINANFEIGPQVLFGNDNLNVGIGSLVGVGASYDLSTSQLSWDACWSPLYAQAQAQISVGPFDANFAYNNAPLGALNFAQSSPTAESLCPFTTTPQPSGALPPGKPTSVSATGGNASAQVSWRAPTANNGAPPTNYLVTPYLNGAAQTQVNTGSTSTSETLSGLQNGSIYAFAVTAVNAAGDGQPSSLSNSVEPTANAVQSVAFVTDEDGNTITPIGGTSAGSPISVGSAPFGVSSVTPNGNDIYVANSGPSSSGGNSVSVISTATHAVVRTVALPSGAEPQGVAISPNGADAYVSDFGTNSISVINTSTYSVSSFSLGSSTQPEMLALSPNGQTLYVAESEANRVAVINTSNNSIVTTISVNAGPLDIAVNPAGTAVYVSSAGQQGVNCGDTVTPISLSTNTAGTPITVGSGPSGLAITPNGSTLYVSNQGFCGPSPVAGNTVTPINLSTGTAGSPITVGAGPGDPAVSPDGSNVLVPNFGNGSTAGTTVSVISTGSNAVTNTIGSAGSGPGAVVFLPDQGPLAAVADPNNVAGEPTTFNASGSVGTSSPIQTYQWSFGDGSMTTTTTPTVSHVYQSANNYSATLTAVDADGASTTETYNGQEAVLNGGSQGTATTAVSESSIVAIPLVGLSNAMAGGISTYSIETVTSANGALAGGGTFSIVAPPGTTLPSGASDYGLSDKSGSTAAVNGVSTSNSAGSSTPNVATVTLSTASLPASDALKIAIADVTNPATPSSDDSLLLSTSADAAPAASDSYAVASAPPSITSTCPTSAREGTNYSCPVTTTGVPIPSLSASGEPAGITFTDNGNGTGSLSGNPTQSGSFAITIMVTNGFGSPASQSFTVTVSPANLCGTATKCITSSSTDSVTSRVHFMFLVTTVGSPTPKISHKGALPRGVKLIDNHNGTAWLQGTATLRKTHTSAVYHPTVVATFGRGTMKQVATQDFTLTVS
jgi:YVTN family beta-propeller protein